MGIRKIIIAEDEYYHFYNRGNSKQAIFLDSKDYDRFIKLLFICNSRKNVSFRVDIVEKGIDVWDFNREDPLVSICSWVLMPNHFHLYIKALSNNGPALFMLKIGTAYAKYFNAKYNRTGSLFEGKFKSVHVENDMQARYLFSYIHLNPVKIIQPTWKEEGIKDKKAAIKFVENYRYSSFKDWAGSERKESLILNKQELYNILPTNFSPRDDVFHWLAEGSTSKAYGEDNET
ncbi:MAG: hypothetical protein A3I26_02585 [Candidatus Yanofskybacteria bacterium RIFCSPLOWO2_02_FULL_43_10]|uniref:Transposase IS200-like domain-containing protein n=1 Tax=Candidatus Yanofskybacteria bacterium RIFCSPLOWO2_12_FULL_43_11b TaxID=1802710 RepID=A0A1F8H906_9BACT|nr:MAG: hypothetical protein A2742_03195 [Candidatus Yanofskybacteria bacterium RIFCSPHIGHO2_01_FULL_43_32]OGN10794.1 MAG: hypothetical protein A3C69_01365 [Candidatus Yanofskybacteria bacterium RIFCSPHIGHO2_02_FULL_43_12]OGN17993.1 MAG: hypothetical protein A3E34_01860 [Candidatus Yanofskybacteria bacterium RIFCSPHIGHO2_12_FULL_43_11]OGN25014.1 MAG: hypothetical protein A2923_03560 [Candidatus Yanofskybacteria bacterium RIFCSPLOWO2_01_FULL_43_46]OGN30172.1 MAG: hypothetical protein A3I26_02585